MSSGDEIPDNIVPDRSAITKEQLAKPFRLELRKHWSSTNVKQARFDSFCQKCRLSITVGEPILFHFGLRRFVHAWCAPAEAVTSTQHPSANETPAQAETTHPSLLSEGSPLNNLSKTYRMEAVRWVQFHVAVKLIPDIHTPFTDTSIKNFLEFRSQTTKGFGQIISALKAMGVLTGFSLHSSRFQQPSLAYQRLRSEKARLNKLRRKKGLDKATKRSIAAGLWAISILLAAFDIRSRKRMARLHPWHQMGITITVGLHAGCGRFGLYEYTDPTREDVVFAAQDNCHHLMVTWRKTRKSNRPYAIRLPCRPPRNNPARYVIPGPGGPTYVAAGQIWSWYLQNMGLNSAPGSTFLFPLLRESTNRREAYTHWLRSVFTMALPAGSPLPAQISPHSMRAGWVSDQTRQQVPIHTIKAQGRWHDLRAVQLYIRTSVRDLSTSQQYRAIPDDVKECWPPQQ